jgi:hypothetical protein
MLTIKTLILSGLFPEQTVLDQQNYHATRLTLFDGSGDPRSAKKTTAPRKDNPNAPKSAFGTWAPVLVIFE